MNLDIVVSFRSLALDRLRTLAGQRHEASHLVEAELTERRPGPEALARASQLGLRIRRALDELSLVFDLLVHGLRTVECRLDLVF